MPVLLGADHIGGPTATDILAWALVALVVLRVGRSGDPRWWLVGGVVLGVGLTNKHSVGSFGIAVALGLLLSGGRRLVLNRWFLASALIAAAFTIPDVWWQAHNGWPTFAMTHELNRENGGAGNIVTWVVGQLLITSIVLVPVWIVGLRQLWRSRLPGAAGAHLGLRPSLPHLRRHDRSGDLLPGRRLRLPAHRRRRRGGWLAGGEAAAAAVIALGGGG